jgi:hypothetical protein
MFKEQPIAKTTENYASDMVLKKIEIFVFKREGMVK